MNTLSKTIVREPSADKPEHYAHRVVLLAVAYAVLFFTSLLGIVLIVQWAKLFVTLSQRSNVETLALLFFIAFYAYFTVISWKGALGALRLLWFRVVHRIRGTGLETIKIAALPPPKEENGAAVAVNVLIRREDGEEPCYLRIEDEYGSMGKVEIDGACLTHLQTYGDGSTDALIYTVHQLEGMLAAAGTTRELAIVEWKSIDDEEMSRYLATVDFARNLQRHLGIEEAWPQVYLTGPQCEELERRLSKICAAIRSETFLPDWEYSAEHKLPLIPEPLGLLSLGHSEKRVDAVSSMVTAAVIVVASVATFLAFIVAPPWVPGS
jgi:hypothetical protein